MVYRSTPIWIFLFLLCTATTFAQNVGIGVDTPQTKLHVAGTILTDSIRLPHGAGKGLILTSDSLGYGRWQRHLDIPSTPKTTLDDQIFFDPINMVANDSTLFVATFGSRGVKSYRIEGSTLVGLDTFSTSPYYPDHMTIDGPIMAMILKSSDSLVMLDISNPSNIYRRSGVEIPSGSAGLAIDEGVLALTNRFENTLSFWNVSNPDSIWLDTILTMGPNPASVMLKDNVAYVADLSYQDLKSYNLSDPSQPVLLDSIGAGASVDDIAINGSLAILAHGFGDSISIVDISNPAALVSISGLKVGEIAFHIDSEGDIASVACNQPDSVYLIDISDPYNPQIMSRVDIDESASDLIMKNSSIFVCSSPGDFVRIIEQCPSIPMIGSNGEITPFDGTLSGRVDIVSPLYNEHLTLSRPGIADFDFRINDFGQFELVGNDIKLMTMRTSDGSVGIGTSNPVHRLQVFDGNINLSTLRNSNRGYLLGYLSPEFGMMYERVGTISSSHFLHFKRIDFSDTTTIMTLTDEGDVGIGTSSPDSKLHVAGSTVVNGNITATGGVIGSKSGNQQLSLIANSSNNYVRIDVGGSGHANDAIVIGDINDADNKVGIGVANPGGAISSVMLEVNGHIAVPNNYGFFSNNAGGTGIGAGVDTHTDDALRLFAGGSTRMTVEPAGDVGIGTTNPAVDLEISSSSPTARLTNSGGGVVQLDFKRTGSDWRVENNAGLLYFGQSSDDLVSVTDVLRLGGGSVTPATDNDVTLGQSPRRWTAVWAVDGTINTSDARLKKDIAPMTEGLHLINQLKPVSFKWKEGHDQGRLHTGFIAQELQEVVPHIVIDHEWREIPDTDQREWVETEHLGVNYSELIPILTKAIQEQQEMIKALEEEVAELRELVIEN